MAMQLEQRTYVRVPRNSTIHIAIKSKAGTSYNLNGRIDRRGVEKKSWSHGQLKNKAVTYKFAKSGSHVVRVASHYTGASSVEVSVEILKPDGSRHSTHWSVVLRGKNRDVSRAKVTVGVRP